MKIRGIGVTWLGHSTFILETPEGKKLLVDPWTKTSPVCPKAYHDFVPDAILVTHGHNDHTGDLLTIAPNCPAPVICIYEIAMFLAGRGIETGAGMNKGGTMPVPSLNIEVSMTDAHHSSAYFEEDGKITYLGEPAGFVVKFSNGTRIYIAGDTCVFGDMAFIKELWAPDLAILPIGDYFTMDPKQAAIAAGLLGVKAVIPCHYGTFPVLTGTPGQLTAELAQRNLDVVVHTLEIG